MRRLCVFSVVFALLVSLSVPSFAFTMDEVGGGSDLVSDPVYSLSADSSLYDVAVVVSDVQPRSTMAGVIQKQAAGHLLSAYTVSGSADSTIDYVISSNAQTMIDNFVNLYNLDASQQEEINALNNSIADVIKAQLGFPAGNSLFAGPYLVANYEGASDPSWKSGNLISVFRSLQNAVYLRSSAGIGILGSTGLTFTQHNQTLGNIVSWGFAGLASVLRGDSGSVVSGSLLDYSDLSTTEFSANNLLSMLSPLLTIQNDVARFAHVIADPEDQALNDANKVNKEEILNSFGSDGAGVKTSDIGDMAGVSGSLSGNLDTGVSVGQAFDQMNDSSRFAFFSQECQDALNPFHSVRAMSRFQDDDFVHFYDPDNSEFWALIGGDE